MEIIRDKIIGENGTRRIVLVADRLTLSRRRWRGMAEDGRDFGFDLEEPLPDGAVFFRDGDSLYAIAQRPEPLLEIAIRDGREGARLGWMIGNLHLPIEPGEGAAFTLDDPSARKLFQREAVSFTSVSKVFHPLAASTHGH